MCFERSMKSIILFDISITNAKFRLVLSNGIPNSAFRCVFYLKRRNVEMRTFRSVVIYDPLYTASSPNSNHKQVLQLQRRASRIFITFTFLCVLIFIVFDIDIACAHAIRPSEQRLVSLSMIA